MSIQTISFNGKAINTNEVTSMKLSTIKQELTAQFTIEKKIVVGVEKARVAGKKGKQHSKGKSKIKRTPIYETRMVVDEAALNRAAKLVLAAKVAEAKEAAKAAFHARNAERAEAVAFTMAMNARKAEISRLDSQIALARSLNPRRVFTKTMNKTIKIGSASAGAIRNAKRAARAVAQSIAAGAKFGPCCPLYATYEYFSNPVKGVSRAEAQALLAASKVRTVASKATSTMEAITAFDAVDSLIATTISTLVKVGSFVAKAQAILENTKNSLPMVAETMTMSLSIEGILDLVHNNVMDSADVEVNHENYEDRVLEQYEDILAEYQIPLTDEIEMAIFEMADKGIEMSVKDWFENYDQKAAIARYNEIAKAINADAKQYWNGETNVDILHDHLSNTINEWEKTKLTARDWLIFWVACGPRKFENIIPVEMVEGVDLDKVSLSDFVKDLDTQHDPMQECFWSNGLIDLLDAKDRGDGNLSKNVTTVEEANPSSVTPVTTTGDSQMTNYINASAFANASAFSHNDGAEPHYSEVAPLVNFGDAEEIINFDGDGKSFAEILASIMYPMEEAMFFESDTEEVRAQIQATVDHKNARASEAQEKFLAGFGDKLGFIKHVTLEYGLGGSYARASYNLKSHFESLFTMAQLPQYENAQTVYSGLELDEFAPRIKVGNANALWLAILAKATYNLTVEERAQLLGLLFHNVAKVDGTVISRDKISIDVANATVTTGNGRVLRANKASCFGKQGGFIVIDGLQSIFLFALQALGGTAKQLETSINLAVKLFQPEHNYGHKPDADDMAHFVRTNFVYTNAVNSTGMSFPSIEIIGGKQDPEFLGWVLHRGVIATCDKTNIKFVTINAGAEAVGVGYSRDQFGNLDQMFTANDANKPTKLFNRAAANNYDCAELPNRVASNFGFALSNGKVARTKGVMMNVAYTNSLLTLGSGVAIINPNTKFEFSISKKEKQPTNLSMFGYKATNNAKFKKAFVEGVEKRISEIKGDTFGPGEVMLFVELGGQRFDLVSNTEEAAEVTVKGGYIRNNVLDENSVEIVLEVDLKGKTGFVKTRRFATKFTTKPYEAEFSVAGEWDIILNNECTKGHGALLEMFANATGERFLNNSTCQFTTPDGDSFDVRGTDNAFYAWRDANIQKDVTLTLSIAKSVWENVKRFCANTVTVIAETTDMDGNPCVVVEETVDVIFGQLVFDVEISSPLESVSNSNLTLESASAIYLQSQRLGNILFEECLAKADKFVALASNFAGQDADGMTVIDLDDEASFNSFLASVPTSSKGTLTQRQLVAGLAAKYPSGVQFFLGKLEFAVNLGLVATFGQFNGLNGSAARETAEIVNFLLDVIYNGASTKDLMINAKRAFAKIVRTGIDSKKVLKKPTRAGKLIYGKVRTSFDPILHTEDGIPTVVMNINCPMVRMLGIPTDGSIVNYYVGFARTPMPFLGGARVRLTADANICDVAHVLVDPYVWHCLNEGDSDGDGIAVMNLSALGFTQAEIVEMNNSVMGIAGYKHLYGENVPFADFMSEKDKAGKKSFRGTISLMSTQVKDPDTDTNVDIVREFVADFAARVANHYKSAVGTSYGICSKLVFQAADLAAAGPSKELDTVLTACLIAWRSMYEGLGLSGYSANAARVFEILMLASNDVRSGKVHVHPITGAVGNAYGKPEAELRAGAEVLKEEFPDLQHVDVDVFHTLITSRCATRMAVKLEGFGNLSNYWLNTPGLEDAGIKYGALRRISQGDDRVAEELGLMEEAQLEATGEYVGKTATRLFNDTVIVEECFTNLLLGEVTAKVCEFHALLVETKQSAIDAEQAGH